MLLPVAIAKKRLTLIFKFLIIRKNWKQVCRKIKKFSFFKKDVYFSKYYEWQSMVYLWVLKSVWYLQLNLCREFLGWSKVIYVAYQCFKHWIESFGLNFYVMCVSMYLVRILPPFLIISNERLLILGDLLLSSFWIAPCLTSNCLFGYIIKFSYLYFIVFGLKS